MCRFINADSLLNSTDCSLGLNLFSYCKNSPINFCDPDGNDAAVLGIGAVIVGGAIASVAVVGIYVVTNFTLTKLRDSIKQAVDTMDEILNNYDNSIYVLRDPDRNNEVVYVGRTSDPKRREKEHKNTEGRENYKFDVILTGLNYPQARAVEQFYISTYTLSNLENARREISKKNTPKFFQHLGIIIDIYQGYKEEEIYNLMMGD